MIDLMLKGSILIAIVFLLIIIADAIHNHWRYTARRYNFYLHDCTGLYDHVIIQAHHFERKDNGGLVFYDGKEDIVFDTDIIFTNVYRGNQINYEKI